MTDRPSRRQLLKTTGFSALAAAAMSPSEICFASSFDGGPLDDSPLPDPTNDKDAYDSAKQYLMKRFNDQLLIKQIDYGLDLPSLREHAPLQLAFLSRNVEQLAQQCASLLERGIATRSEYELVAEKDLATLTDLAEFLLRDGAFQTEAQLGYYSIDSRSAQADQDAASVYVNAVNATSGTIQQSLQPESRSEQARADYLQKRADFEKNTIATRRSRAQALRQAYALRVLSYAQGNGPHNYPARLDVLKKRFLLDFASASTRFPALYQGVKEIYGYDQATLIDKSSSLFDDALIWLRNIAEFLVSFGVTDQGYTLPVSIRSIVGSAAWKNAFEKGTGQIAFSISEDLFPQQRYVRLRGISVYAVCSDPGALFSVALQAPATSYIRHKDATQVPLKQEAPLTRIGRVQSRNSFRDADIVGAVTLNNVSPFGQWSLGVTDNYPTLSKSAAPRQYDRGMVKQLDDIVVDLHVNVQQATTTA
jgi:hypothetical protein